MSSSWRCGLVEVLSFDFGQCIYHTIPYVVDGFCFCSGYPFNAAFVSDGRMVQYLGKLIQEVIKYIDLLRCFMGSTFALWDAKVKRVE